MRLQEAQELSNKILEYGKSFKLNPLSVVVLDKGGHILCALRDENAGILRFDIAKGKAWGALGMGFGTRTFASMAESSDKMKAFVQSLTTMSEGKVVPTQGGVIIRNLNGDMIGAVGVSGDSSENDELCILKAIKDMGMIAQP